MSDAVANVVRSGILNGGTGDTRKPGKGDEDSETGRNCNHGKLSGDLLKACVFKLKITEAIPVAGSIVMWKES